MTKSIYNLRTIDAGHIPFPTFAITKFDHSLEIESTYTVSHSDCECPQFQGRSKTCRHMKMLPMFLALNRVDTEYFLDFDTKTWHRPLLPEYEVEYHDLEVAKRECLKAAPQPTGLQVIPKADPTAATGVSPTGEASDRESEPRLATKGEPPTEAAVPCVASAPLVASSSEPAIKRRRV